MRTAAAMGDAHQTVEAKPVAIGRKKKKVDILGTFQQYQESKKKQPSGQVPGQGQGPLIFNFPAQPNEKPKDAKMNPK